MQLSLRQKLFLVSLLLIAIPWLGIRYVQAIENYLQELVLANLHSYTQSVAVSLVDELNLVPDYPSGPSLYATPLRLAPQVDGYDADWGDFSGDRVPITTTKATNNTPHLSLGRFADDLYLYLAVPDENIQYQRLNSAPSWYTSSDAIILEMPGAPVFKRMVIVTEAPGVVFGRDARSGQRDSRLQGCGVSVISVLVTS